jgi:hypothetical protein
MDYRATTRGPSYDHWWGNETKSCRDSCAASAGRASFRCLGSAYENVVPAMYVVHMSAHQSENLVVVFEFFEANHTDAVVTIEVDDIRFWG